MEVFSNYEFKGIIWMKTDQDYVILNQKADEIKGIMAEAIFNTNDFCGWELADMEPSARGLEYDQIKIDISITMHSF